MISKHNFISAILDTSSLTRAADQLGINRNAVAKRLKAMNTTRDDLLVNGEQMIVKSEKDYIEAINSLTKALEFDDLSKGEITALKKIIKSISERM